MSSRGSVAPIAPPAPLLLRAGFWICIVIAVAVVFRRVFALAVPSRAASSQSAALDLAFANHAALTLCHILPALLFVILAPIVIFRKTERLAWADQLLLPVGVIVGLTAYAMSFYSVGWNSPPSCSSIHFFFFRYGRSTGISPPVISCGNAIGWCVPSSSC
jgi:hypothetical protein